VLVAELALDRQALRVTRARPLLADHVPQVVERDGDPELVPELPPEREALLVE
jgi:hypothetical protein